MKRPQPSTTIPLSGLSSATSLGVALFVGGAMSAAILVLGIGGWKVRVWNPSREVRLKAPEPETSEESENSDAPESWKVRPPRAVWKNPILWREVRTWAYGR